MSQSEKPEDAKSDEAEKEVKETDSETEKSESDKSKKEKPAKKAKKNALRFLSSVKHDGVFYSKGEALPQDVITKKQLKRLIEVGAVG